MTRRRWLVALLLLASACSSSDSSATATATATATSGVAAEPTAPGNADVVVTVAFEVADGGVTVTATLHHSTGTAFEIPYMWELQHADGDSWSTVGFMPWVGNVAATPPALCPAENTCEVAPSIKIVNDGESMQLVAHVARLADGSYRVVAPGLAGFTQANTAAEFES